MTYADFQEPLFVGDIALMETCGKDCIFPRCTSVNCRYKTSTRAAFFEGFLKGITAHNENSKK